MSPIARRPGCESGREQPNHINPAAGHRYFGLPRSLRPNEFYAMSMYVNENSVFTTHSPASAPCTRSALWPALGLLLIVSSTAAAGCSWWKSDEKKTTTENGAPPGATSAVPLWPAPKVIWQTPYKGAVLPLAATPDTALAVSYRVRRHWAAPRRLAGFRLDDGRKRWETRKAPKMMRRTAPWSISHAVHCHKKRCVLVYQRSRDRVRAIDTKTGDARWRDESEHGVALCADEVALAADKHLRLLHPETGKVVRTVDLADPKTGGRANGVMTALQEKSGVHCPPAAPHRFLIARDDGGQIQSLDTTTGKLVWRFDVEGDTGEHLFSLPHAEDTILVPTLFPDTTRAAELAAWPVTTQQAKPAWRLEIEGRVRTKWIKRNSDRILLRASTESDREFLVRLERRTGKRLSRVQIPDIKHCVPGGKNVYYCRGPYAILALATPDGDLLWKSALGPKRRRVHSVWSVGPWVAAETAAKLWLLDAKTGKPVSHFPKKLGSARIDINAVLGPDDDRLYLVVKTFQATAALDRRYLLSIDGRTGKILYQKRLGRPTPSTRESRIRYKERDLGVPVLYLPAANEPKPTPPRIFSAVGRLIRLINGADGKVIREFGMPGEKDRPTGLLSTNDGVAIVERGDLMMAVDIDEARLLWRKFAPQQELILHHGPEAFLEDGRGRLEWISPKGAKPLPESLRKAMGSERPDLAMATEHLFIARAGKKAHFIDRQTGKMVGELAGHWVFIRQDDFVLGIRQLRREGKNGRYSGLHSKTGKVRWKRTVSEPQRKTRPNSAAAATADTKTVPPVFAHERRWPVNWMHGATTAKHPQAKGVFLITDAVGRCVFALDGASGKNKWTACFGKLTGPPQSARGYLFLTARSPARSYSPADPAPTPPVAADPKSKRPPADANDRAHLYAIRLHDGRIKKIFFAPEGKNIKLGMAPPSPEGLLLCTLESAGNKKGKDELVALELWPAPKRIARLGFLWPFSPKAWKPLIGR